MPSTCTQILIANPFALYFFDQLVSASGYRVQSSAADKNVSPRTMISFSAQPAAVLHIDRLLQQSMFRVSKLSILILLHLVERISLSGILRLPL